MFKIGALVAEIKKLNGNLERIAISLEKQEKSAQGARQESVQSLHTLLNQVTSMLPKGRTDHGK